MSSLTKRILVTGPFGQIGSELVPVLCRMFGEENVIVLGHTHIPPKYMGILEKGDVTDMETLFSLNDKYRFTGVYHLASILSAAGEKEPGKTWRVNMDGLRNILDLAAQYKIRVFWPSSIAVFGKSSGTANVPQNALLEPSTMYGITKVAGELLSQYYFKKYGTDVRSVRFPGIISYKTPPGGGTTDYAVAMYYSAVAQIEYRCFVRSDTVLPMMYMNDALKAVLQIMEVTREKITVHTSYNLAALSFSAKELEEEIRKHFPLKVRYVPDERQKIADSWPRSVNDEYARKDWGWEYDFGLVRMTEEMITHLTSSNKSGYVKR